MTPSICLARSFAVLRALTHRSARTATPPSRTQSALPAAATSDPPRTHRSGKAAACCAPRRSPPRWRGSTRHAHVAIEAFAGRAASTLSRLASVPLSPLTKRRPLTCPAVGRSRPMGGGRHQIGMAGIRSESVADLRRTTQPHHEWWQAGPPRFAGKRPTRSLVRSLAVNRRARGRTTIACFAPPTTASRPHFLLVCPNTVPAMFRPSELPLSQSRSGTLIRKLRGVRCYIPKRATIMQPVQGTGHAETATIRPDRNAPWPRLREQIRRGGACRRLAEQIFWPP